jgi:uncharacterized protein (TIGR01244 family)
MHERMRINEQITAGRQPTAEELKELAREGFRSVVNLRTWPEEDQPLSPEAEGAQVRDLGLEYLHLPVSTNDLRPEQVDQFRQMLPQLPKPVYVHCHTGKRAGALVMMHMATEQGWSGQEALGKAEEMGYACDVPQLQEFFLHYIDQRRRP